MLENNGYMLLFGGCLVWILYYILAKIDEFGWGTIKEYLNKLFKNKNK